MLRTLSLGQMHTEDTASEVDMTLVQRLAECARLAKRDQAEASSAYQTTGEWPIILNEDVSVSQSLSNDSALALALANMFRDPGHTAIGSAYTIRRLNGLSAKGLVKKAFIRRSVFHDLAIWKAVSDSQDVRVLAAPPIGNPWGVTIDGTLIYPGVFRAHYFAQQVSNLLNHSKGTLVAEIGGGYGELAYRLLTMRPGTRYIGFDLPEVLIKASYFLMSAFSEKRFLLYDQIRGGIPDDYDIALLPNFMLPKLQSSDVTINIRSLSEMGRETVNEYVSHICRFSRRYFLHENSNTAVLSYGGHYEVPASEFPITGFDKLYAHKSPWADGVGRYVEYLYARQEP